MPQVTGSQMITNEKGRIDTDRQKALEMPVPSIHDEIIGNLNGNYIYIEYNLESSSDYPYYAVFITNDGGFSDNDWSAIKQKNMSCKKKHTTSINGIGCRLAIDRMKGQEDGIDTDDTITILSFRKDGLKQRLYIGGFDFYPENYDDMKFTTKPLKNKKLSKLFEYKCKEYPDGITMWYIPIAYDYMDSIVGVQTENTHITEIFRRTTQRYFNRRIHDGSLIVEFNNGISTSALECDIPLCPKNVNNRYLEMDVSIGYGTSRSLILKIDNYNEFKEKYPYIELPEYISTKYYNKFNNFKQLCKYSNGKKPSKFDYIESGTLRILSLWNTDTDIREKQINLYSCNNSLISLDGLFIYKNNNCLNEAPITDYLGGKVAGGGIWSIGKTGVPRFEYEIKETDKRSSILYSLSEKKSKTCPTAKGLVINKIFKILYNKYFSLEPNKSHHCYCLKDLTRPNMRKIGMSDKIDIKLLKQYNTRNYPKGIEIIKWEPFDNNRLGENNLIDQLKEYQIENTEWFEWDNTYNDTKIDKIIDNVFEKTLDYLNN
tara:strand:- start:5366 stop:6997 length:1632 start_codon:yes stop_codon:yes gene_type:complete